jgi:hypothetical protein
MTMTENDDLRETVEQLAERVEELEHTLDEEREQRRELEERVEDLEDERDELRRDVAVLESRADALADAAEENAERAAELYTRELEKGGHVLRERIEPIAESLETGEDLETLRKDDGRQYVRLPGVEDADAPTAPSAGGEDLLPIQQLARMDDDTLASCTDKLPDELAARLWEERDRAGRPGSPWTKGCKSVREYVDGGELAQWIRTTMKAEKGEPISKQYAQKLAGRTMDALRDLTRTRVKVDLRSRRQDGLEYRERRLVVPSDAEIPGEGSPDASPETNGVVGG